MQKRKKERSMTKQMQAGGAGFLLRLSGELWTVQKQSENSSCCAPRRGFTFLCLFVIALLHLLHACLRPKERCPRTALVRAVRLATQLCNGECKIKKEMGAWRYLNLLAYYLSSFLYINIFRISGVPNKCCVGGWSDSNLLPPSALSSSRCSRGGLRTRHSQATLRRPLPRKTTHFIPPLGLSRLVLHCASVEFPRPFVFQPKK